MQLQTSELLGAGLLHGNLLTVPKGGMADYAGEPMLANDAIDWLNLPAESGDIAMLRPVSDPFMPDGGMRLVHGNLGWAIFKTSSVDAARWRISAPAAVFSNQNDVLTAFAAGELDRDVFVVVRFQGTRANGMPELHKLTPLLSVLQDKGFNVALFTDGRMSGASGKVPAAIHCTPEAYDGGPLAHIRDGDMVTLCGHNGLLSVNADLESRESVPALLSHHRVGREMFAMLRHHCDSAERGASAMLHEAGL